MAVRHSRYDEAGRVRVDMLRCTGCELCVKTCPAEVLALEAGTVVQRDVGFGCIACGHCMMVCPADCIRVTGRDLREDDLGPLPPLAERADAASLAALFRARRSVRRFEQREIAPNLIDEILTMASTAPMGIPPWDVGVASVNGFDAVRELAGEVIAGYRGMTKIMRPGLLRLLRPLLGEARFQRISTFILPLAEMYLKSWDEGRDAVFWGAPTVLLFHHAPYADPPDAVIACTYAMLAAESLGLGSCMIGGAPPILQRNKGLCEKLGIPRENKPVLALILGYSAVPFARGITRRFGHVQKDDGPG